MMKVKENPKVVVKINGFSERHPFVAKFVWPFVVSMIVPFLIAFLMH